MSRSRNMSRSRSRSRSSSSFIVRGVVHGAVASVATVTLNGQ